VSFFFEVINLNKKVCFFFNQNKIEKKIHKKMLKKKKNKSKYKRIFFLYFILIKKKEIRLRKKQYLSYFCPSIGMGVFDFFKSIDR